MSSETQIFPHFRNWVSGYTYVTYVATYYMRSLTPSRYPPR